LQELYVSAGYLTLKFSSVAQYLLEEPMNSNTGNAILLNPGFRMLAALLRNAIIIFKPISCFYAFSTG